MDMYNLLVIDEPDIGDISSLYAISLLLQNDVAAQEVAVAEHLNVGHLASSTYMYMYVHEKGAGATTYQGFRHITREQQFVGEVLKFLMQ